MEIIVVKSNSIGGIFRLHNFHLCIYDQQKGYISFFDSFPTHVKHIVSCLTHRFILSYINLDIFNCHFIDYEIVHFVTWVNL